MFLRAGAIGVMMYVFGLGSARLSWAWTYRKFLLRLFRYPKPNTCYPYSDDFWSSFVIDSPMMNRHGPSYIATKRNHHVWNTAYTVEFSSRLWRLPYDGDHCCCCDRWLGMLLLFSQFLLLYCYSSCRVSGSCVVRCIAAKSVDDLLLVSVVVVGRRILYSDGGM